MMITFFNDNTMEELLYDELPMITTFNVDDREDIILPYILENKIDNESKYSQKRTPIRNSMDIGEHDYQPLLTSIQYSLNVLTEWVNNVVFSQGEAMPFNEGEIYTAFRFKRKAFHIIFEVEPDAGEFFEEEWWDEDELEN